MQENDQFLFCSVTIAIAISHSYVVRRAVQRCDQFVLYVGPKIRVRVQFLTCSQIHSP